MLDGEGGGGGRIDDETVVFQREGGQLRKVRNRHLFDEGEGMVTDVDRRQFRESRKNQGFGGLVVPSVLADI